MGKPVNTRSSAQPAGRPTAGQSVPGPVDKAMEVLSALVAGGAPHRLADLARRTGLAKPTVHRLLRGLADAGFAEPAEGGSYRPGPRLLGLAAAALDGGPELRAARPVLADLRTRTGLCAHYAVRDGTATVCLDVSEPAREYAVGPRPGARSPLLGSAAGLAVLAASPAAETEAEIARAEAEQAETWERFTGENGAVSVPPTSSERLRAAVDLAARRGYAVDDGYVREDQRAVASVVREGTGRVVGALVLTGLAFTLDDASVELYGPMVRAAAGSVSAALGEHGPRLGLVSGRTFQPEEAR
ncbi:IclR family transcriptional regulator [Streptomyces sp. NPDC007088]|uniref:IclR family transcriptional regulator n=1 Tax=Streptomyces sp. NPDC007088 TaxID=3364773 RepID=UPI0036A2E1D8